MTSRGGYADDRERRLHARYRLLAAAAVDGRIDPEDAADLEAHLLTCDPCSAELAAMEADHRLLAQPARVALPDPRVRTAALDAARSPRVPRVGAPPRPWAALLAAGLIVAVIGTGLVLSLRRPTTPGALPSPAPDASTAVLPTAATARCVVIPAGLSARWHFDSPAEHLTGQPIELAGEVGYGEGISGSGLELTPGVNIATFPHPDNLQFDAGDFTISLWVRFASISGEQVLLERFRETPRQGWSLAKTDAHRIALTIATAEGDLVVESKQSVVAGPWQHLVVRRSGPTFSIFLGGVLNAVTDADPASRIDLDSELPLLFGRSGAEGGGALDGTLDEVLAWNGLALEDREIADLRRGDDEGFCEAAAGAGYEGSWTTMDCATQGATVDCERWGDGRNVALVIGPGEEPAVLFQDDAVDGCGAGGGSGPRVASGRAAFEGVYLWVRFEEVDCGQVSESWADPMQLYKGLGDPSIWFDPDGDNWGLVYRPA